VFRLGQETPMKDGPLGRALVIFPRPSPLWTLVTQIIDILRDPRRVLGSPVFDFSKQRIPLPPLACRPLLLGKPPLLLSVLLLPSSIAFLFSLSTPRCLQVKR